MTSRHDALDTFIARSGWQESQRVVVAGDASNRRYLRLTQSDGQTTILMDAPPDTGEDVTPFLHIARHLSAQGFSAPAILAEDTTSGFLLIEDLGDDLFARVLRTDTDQENSLYSVATDLLLDLHDCPLPEGLAPYSVPYMAEMAALSVEWYASALTGPDPAARQRLHDAMAGALALLDGLDEVLIQRDYHAENLIWLPARSGTARVGLLDFQDAMRGHRAYDLVSLLQDARRDVTPETESVMLSRYIAAWGGNPERFSTAYHVLGAQRNLRILGVFARLCLRDGKAQYVDLIPRVWDHLMLDLRHPALAQLARLVQDILPPPTATTLQRLRSQCQTRPST